MYLVTKWFGTFVCDKNGIKKEILFPNDEIEIVKRLRKIEKNIILPEEKKISKGLKVIVNEKRLQKIGEYIETEPFFKKIKINPKKYGFSKELFHKISLTLAREKVDERLQSEDLQIIQMVNALDDLIQTLNLFSERLSCWSIIPTSKEKIKPFENLYSTVNDEIKRLEKQIERDMKKIAPNTSNIVGPLIGARLLSLAGGLQKLAVMPASTIQILGAEKALFRYKKEGGKPPKHGVIFQHPLINRSFRDERGKIARILANKITIAVKADVFTKRDISKELKKDLDTKVKEIRNK
jgi:nucleolar protein 56